MPKILKRARSQGRLSRSLIDWQIEEEPIVTVNLTFVIAINER